MEWGGVEKRRKRIFGETMRYYSRFTASLACSHYCFCLLSFVWMNLVQAVFCRVLRRADIREFGEFTLRWVPHGTFNFIRASVCDWLSSVAFTASPAHAQLTSFRLTFHRRVHDAIREDRVSSGLHVSTSAQGRSSTTPQRRHAQLEEARAQKRVVTGNCKLVVDSGY